MNNAETKSKTSDLALILVNYNTEAYTKSCIESLNKGSLVPDVILIDNASKEFDAGYFSEIAIVSVIESKENLGFAGGNNIGIRLALDKGYRYIGLLNNDTVVDEHMVENLYDRLQIYPLVVPKMYYYARPEVLWYAGGRFNRLKGEAFHAGVGEKDEGQFDEEKDVDFATGCCFIAERSVFEKAGLISEEYFMYCEDTDFCLKCKKAGIGIRYIPSAKLWHKIGASTGNESAASAYYRNRNRVHLIKKFKLGIVPLFFTVSTRFFKWLKGLILRNNNRVILKATLDGLVGRMGKRDLTSKAASKKEKRK